MVVLRYFIFFIFISFYLNFEFCMLAEDVNSLLASPGDNSLLYLNLTFFNVSFGLLLCKS